MRLKAGGKARSLIPALDWAANYQRDYLSGDIIAGLTTAVILVPQAMAYAILAGLPPQIGLYASIAPLLVYAIFGSSRTLSVGPVALISLLTANAITPFAATGSQAYVEAAIMLALMVGVLSIGLGLIKAGFLTNFLSHTVISGFISAASVTIAVTSLRDLFGLSLPRAENAFAGLVKTITNLPSTNTASALIGLGGIAFLLVLRRRWRALSRLGPLCLVALATFAVWWLSPEGVKTVGVIPPGLPPLGWPVIDVELAQKLLPDAILITLIGFLESVSVAKGLAAKRRQHIDANQELFGLGAANIAASLTSGYPITGGFGRSNVNLDSGANTPLAAIITAAMVALTVSFLTPLFYALPLASLSAIIIVSVVQLIDVSVLRHAWRYDKGDALALLTTFFGVILYNVETGLLAGVILSLILFLRRTATPHIAIVGRVGSTEHFRNINRHKVSTDPAILLMRIDESLYFANARVLEAEIMHRLSQDHRIHHVVLICSAVNAIDFTALEALERLVDSLTLVSVTLHLAEVKGPVMDRLQGSAFMDKLPPGRVFLSTHEAMHKLQSEADREIAPTPDLNQIREV